MTDSLHFPIGIAWAIAFVVEALGLSAISTIIGFWSYNRRYKDEKRKAPVALALFSFTFYLSIVIIMNVALDAANIPGSFLTFSWVSIGANALLTLLSVPAAILLAIRTEHKTLLDNIDRMRSERRLPPIPLQVQHAAEVQVRTESGSQRRGKVFLTDYKTGRLTERLDKAGLQLSAASIAKLYNVDERTAYRWLKVVRNQT